jgi:hypothetical protein
MDSRIATAARGPMQTFAVMTRYCGHRAVDDISTNLELL